MGRQVRRMHKQRRKRLENIVRMLENQQYISFSLWSQLFFHSDFRSEFTLRPKTRRDLFPSLKLLHAGGHFIAPNTQNLYMIKAELGQNYHSANTPLLPGGCGLGGAGGPRPRSRSPGSGHAGRGNKLQSRQFSA